MPSVAEEPRPVQDPGFSTLEVVGVCVTMAIVASSALFMGWRAIRKKEMRVQANALIEDLQKKRELRWRLNQTGFETTTLSQKIEKLEGDIRQIQHRIKPRRKNYAETARHAHAKEAIRHQMHEIQFPVLPPAPAPCRIGPPPLPSPPTLRSYQPPKEEEPPPSLGARLKKSFSGLLKNMTQVGPKPGRPVDIGSRRPDLIHEITEASGPQILREMLQRKYPPHPRLLAVPGVEYHYKPWNIVIFENEGRLEVRVADSFDPRAVVDSSGRDNLGKLIFRIYMEKGIKHDQVAEGKKCIFAGTLQIEGGEHQFKILLRNDSGAYGPEIRIYPEKIDAVKTVLAKRFGISDDDIHFEPVQLS